jgi:hypothetical protein
MASFPACITPLRSALLAYAAGAADDAPHHLTLLHYELGGLLDWSERHALFDEVLAAVEAGPVRVTALLPFLIADDDWLLVRRAAEATWRLWLRAAECAEEDRVTAMLRHVTEQIEDLADGPRAGAILAGMLRAAELRRDVVRLHGAWRLLDREGRLECMRQLMGLTSLPALEWLDSWARESDRPDEAAHLRALVDGALHRAAQGTLLERRSDGEVQRMTSPQVRARLAARARRLGGIGPCRAGGT